MSNQKDRKGASKKRTRNAAELEFDQVRLDVFKFGLKHLDRKDKETTKVDRLKRLGAEVKNRKFFNFRKMMEYKEKQKQKDLTSDKTLKKHLAVELKKQIDHVKGRMDRKKANKKRFNTSAFKKTPANQKKSK